MKTYKKGISLIVLVVTVIVLSILATTVIISLSNTNIIDKASKTVEDYNSKQLKEAINTTLLLNGWYEGKGITKTELEKVDGV